VTVFQATTFVLTAAAAIFLREPVGWRRWAAIAIGFLGVLIVARPGVDSFNVGFLFMFGSIASVVLRDLTTRRLPPAMPTLLVIGVASIALAAAGAAMSLFETWLMPPIVPVIELGAAAAIVVAGYQFLILSLRTGDLSVAAPFRYTVIVWGTILGFLIWRVVPDPFTIIGTVVIIASGIYMFQRERRLARLPTLDEP
jgi:drug/metabolite transporter (DMT)-like permease